MEGKHVFITGASSGVGFACAVKFASEGWSVTGTARDEAKSEAARKAFAALGHKISVEPLELRDENAIADVSQRVLAESPIHVLVNNAGLAVYGPIDEADDVAIALQYETNVFAPIRLIRAFSPAFRAQRTGAIVNVSSGSGFVAQPYDGLYSSSKHAMEGFSEALHWELRPFGIRVALIQLGRFDTPIRSKIAFTRGFGPNSPHWAHYETWRKAAETHLWAGSDGEDPAVAAQSIYEAATTDRPRLRWLVGKDVEAAARWRSAGTFEDYERALRTHLQLEALL